MYRLTATMTIFALALGFQVAHATPPQPGADLDENVLAMHRMSKTCVRSALSTAAAKAHQPALTAYYEASTNGRDVASQIGQTR